MRLPLVLILGLLAGSDALAQDHSDRTLNRLVSMLSVMPEAQHEDFIRLLAADGRVPYVAGDSVAFLYRGPADAVAFNGDFNSWGSSSALVGRRVGTTNTWYATTSLPRDGRLDYKVVVDGDWMLDPLNPRTQWSGFGPNSELRMPEWQPSPYAERSEGVPAGMLEGPFLLTSDHLGYDVGYSVYVPAGYRSGTSYPVLYVTDGHEYADERVGALPVTLDNLIADNRAEPVVVVFIDPRSVSDPAENRRVAEFLANESYLAFVTEELIPNVENAFQIAVPREQRGILGTSFGGVFALYAGLNRPDIFGHLGVQSPALHIFYNRHYWRGPSLLDAVAEAGDEFSPRVFLTTGTLSDGQDLTRRLRDALDARGLLVGYVERNEGHSWGNWRGVMGELLIALFPAER